MRCSIVLALALASATTAAPAQLSHGITVFPGAGYAESAYAALVDAIQPIASTDAELCVAHSNDGATAALLASESPERCRQGVVLLAAAPDTDALMKSSAPVLVVAGSIDGVSRISRFAALRHITSTYPEGHRATRVFAALRGASHHSFASGAPSPLVHQLDLLPELSAEAATKAVSALIADFILPGNDSGALAAAQSTAEEISKPLTDALQLEGSTKLGQVACNSDFPTNPSCQYPKWPDHSLPFGPAPAPSPPLASDCICGSPWVMQQATAMIADFADSEAPNTALTTNDAYQDVSDTHPFHLPHIFNSCEKGSTSCTLNTTTLTMPNDKAGDLFPNASDAPLSLYEFKTKLKSREALWDAVGLSASSSVDTNVSMCKDINQAAWDWALKHADDTTRGYFEANGEPFVIVDDKQSGIGVTGPEWIADEMVYTRVSNSDGSSHIEVQSWYFPVGNTNGGSVPWFFPVGMHYCKLLSPARAMEWIYSDGLRQSRAMN